MLFADVIVNISVEALDRTYQYKIRPEEEHRAIIGASVLVPFGRRNLSGFIISLSNEPKIDIKKIKELAFSDHSLVMESQLMGLAVWMHETYGATMNDALRTVMPIKEKVRQKDDSVVTLKLSLTEVKDEIELRKKKKHYAKLRLLEALVQNNGSMKKQDLNKNYKITPTMIQAAEKEGWITVEKKQLYRNPITSFTEGSKLPSLNEEQREITNDFKTEYKKGIYRTYLLYGVTGSGKTRVYIEMIDAVIKSGRQVIVLIPEIALTKQMVERFTACFGERVSILNSRMSAGEKYDQFIRAKKGEIDILVGPRSALFIPFERLGLIIIDEEHDGSYKSENPPKYHARETAIKRAELAGASVILGSATPSVEVYNKCEKGEYKKYILNSRAGAGTIPETEVVDLRNELNKGNRTCISRSLKENIKSCLDRREQVMLFLNRRGFAGFVSCRNCGHVLKCSHCDVSLTSHKDRNGKINRLACHYCGQEVLMPEQCPECGSSYIASFGLGTQQVEDVIKKMFPKARVSRMDGDTTTGKYGHEKVLSGFRNGETDILIGTQMIVKGHDFHNVTLVGILAADLSLYANDYRAGEKTFQLLMQASGRAGRGDKPGKVIIQTYSPNNYCIKAVLEQDYQKFYENEMAYRRVLQYPPYYNILSMLMTGSDEEELANICNNLAKEIREIANKVEGIVIGPAKANLSKTKDQYRYAFYIKVKSIEKVKQLRNLLEETIQTKQMDRICKVYYDINPTGNF